VVNIRERFGKRKQNPFRGHLQAGSWNGEARMRHLLLRLIAAAVVIVMMWMLRAKEEDGFEPSTVRISQADYTVGSPIEGAWMASHYVLASGDTHHLRGRNFFTADEWTVVFFVLDEGGTPRRASAEGGTYFVADNVVTFRHEYNFSRGDEIAGMAKSALRMEVMDRGLAAEEPTPFAVEGPTLSLFFPSGNKMTFVRSGATSSCSKTLNRSRFPGQGGGLIMPPSG